jgi:hypothetical protein
VQVFDPKREQASKDEQGKGKIQVVIDWPKGAGIQREKVTSFSLNGPSILITATQTLHISFPARSLPSDSLQN